MSFLAQPLENAHHALGLATVDIQYRQDLPLGRHRVGGPVGEALDVNRASLAVLCLQALDVSLRYIKFLGYHFGTPAPLQLPDGVPYGPVRQLWLHSSL